jgi:serine/threonine protein kinase
LSRSLAPDGTADESGVGLRAGDTFLGFELIEELGQGAFARVFLARQQSLAGRPVALKVTLRPTREAERLARLQHTNVVPVYSVHNAPPVQVICMPYLGRRTIADVIRAYRADHSSREHVGRKTSGTRAARTTDLVESGSGPKSGPKPVVAPKPVTVAPGDVPGLVGDPIAVLRVLGQLAAGLAHAHGRGILHLDLKPANVLLPDTGEAMLLDFNLSFDTNAADRELVGGTVPYMATEQLLDLRSRGRGAVDARTDLYSLGVMAFEMMTGVVPFPAASKDLIDMDGLIAARREGPPSIRKLNPAVTPAAEAIIHKLLAPEPKDRYQSAEELKTDVERHLNDLPLQVAREPSLRERFGKWRRRNPGVPARLLAACVFGLALHRRARAGGIDGQSRGAGPRPAHPGRARHDPARPDSAWRNRGPSPRHRQGGGTPRRLRVAR